MDALVLHLFLRTCLEKTLRPQIESMANDAITRAGLEGLISL